MPRCIYCKKQRRLVDFSSVEHVIPQAIGKFTPENILLNDRLKKIKHVCNTCNNYFSKFELWFGRDSLEGYILRPEFIGNGNGDTERQRLKIIVAEGEYKGLHMELKTANNISPLPQISLMKKDGRWDYFLLKELHNINKEDYILEEKSLRAYGLTIEEAEQIYRGLDIKFIHKGDLSTPPSVNCLITSKIDRVIKRTIAKIAFNFFSYTSFALS